MADRTPSAAKIGFHPSGCRCESCLEFERLAAESAHARTAAQIHQRLLRARRAALHALILALGVPKQHRHAAYITLRKALRYGR